MIPVGITRTETAAAMLWAAEEHHKRRNRHGPSEHRLLLEHLGDLALSHYLRARGIRHDGGLHSPDGRPFLVWPAERQVYSIIIRTFATGDMLAERLTIPRAEHAEKTANIYVSMRIKTREATEKPWAQASLDGWIWWSGFENYAVERDGDDGLLSLSTDSLENFAAFDDNLQRDGS